jgi:hypothetical protein
MDALSLQDKNMEVQILEAEKKYKLSASDNTSLNGSII